MITAHRSPPFRIVIERVRRNLHANVPDQDRHAFGVGDREVCVAVIGPSECARNRHAMGVHPSNRGQQVPGGMHDLPVLPRRDVLRPIRARGHGLAQETAREYFRDREEFVVRHRLSVPIHVQVQHPEAGCHPEGA